MRAREFMELAAAIEVSEDDTIEPVKPLTPEQSRRRSERQNATQQKMRDEDARHATKLRDLRSKIATQ